MEHQEPINNIEDLLIEFVDEKGKGFCESVYDRYYATVAGSFKDEVEEYCKVVIFGNEYRLNTQELYDFDQDAAVEEWRNYVDRSLGEDFHEWVEQVIRDDIEDFISRFQQWLAKLDDDERVADAAVALLNGDIDLTEIIVDWLRYRLGYEAWEYPA